VNIRTAALGVAIAGLAVAGCNTAATVASPPKPPPKSAAAQATTAPAQPPAPATATRSASARPPRAGGSGNPGGCDPALWQHIYHPYRLHLVSSCKTVTGTVQAVLREADGDDHILVKLDSPYAGLVNAVNVSQENGDLVSEAICVGTVTQGDAVAACHGFANHVTIPAAGDHVRITGSYVLDADHGWMEIHPVSVLTVIGHQPVTAPSSAQPPPSALPPASGCYPKTGSGNCYEPGEFCSIAEHGEIGVAGDGRTITCTDVNGSWRWED
jgi:hypothetical protein